MISYFFHFEFFDTMKRKGGKKLNYSDGYFITFNEDRVNKNGFYIEIDCDFLLEDGSLLRGIGTGAILKIFSSKKEAKEFLAKEYKPTRVRLTTGSKDLSGYQIEYVRVVKNVYHFDLKKITLEQAFDISKKSGVFIANEELGFPDSENIYTIGKIHNDQVRSKGFIGKYYMD